MPSHRGTPPSGLLVNFSYIYIYFGILCLCVRTLVAVVQAENVFGVPPSFSFTRRYDTPDSFRFAYSFSPLCPGCCWLSCVPHASQTRPQLLSAHRSPFFVHAHFCSCIYLVPCTCTIACVYVVIRTSRSRRSPSAPGVLLLYQVEHYSTLDRSTAVRGLCS